MTSERRQFCFILSNLNDLNLFILLYSVERIFSAVLNISDESVHLCLAPNLREKEFSLPH